MEEFVARLAKVAEFIEGIVADKEALKEAEARVAELQAAVDAKDAVIAGLVDAAAAHATKDDADKAQLEEAVVALEDAVARAKEEPAEEGPVNPKPENPAEPVEPEPAEQEVTIWLNVVVRKKVAKKVVKDFANSNTLGLSSQGIFYLSDLFFK